MAGRDAHIRRAILRSTVFRGQMLHWVDDGEYFFYLGHRDLGLKATLCLSMRRLEGPEVGTTYMFASIRNNVKLELQLESLMISDVYHAMSIADGDIPDIMVEIESRTRWSGISSEVSLHVYLGMSRKTL